MVILGTVSPQDHDYLLGFQGNGSVYVWDLRRIVDRQCHSTTSYGTSTYPQLSSINFTDRVIFKAKQLGQSMVMCSHESVSLTNTNALLAHVLDKNRQAGVWDKSSLTVHNTSMIEQPHEKQYFSTFHIYENSLVLGLSNSTVAIYDLEQQKVVCKVLTHNYSGSFHTQSNSYMICGTAQPNDNQIIAGNASGNIYEIDIRVGKRTKEYFIAADNSQSQMSPVVSLSLGSKHLYVCHEDYISKWNWGMEHSLGIIDLGFEYSAMVMTQQGLLIGGNVPYLYCISQNDLAYKRWDTSNQTLFAINEFHGILTAAGTGPYVDVFNRNDRICTLAVNT